MMMEDLDDEHKWFNLIILLLSSLPTVSFWRGLWSLYNVILWDLENCKIYKRSYWYPPITSLIILFIRTFVSIIGIFLHHKLKEKLSFRGHLIFKKMYIIIQSFVVVIYWKCIFDCCYILKCFYNPSYSVILPIGGIILTFMFRLPRNLISNPAVISYDSDENVFAISTPFGWNDGVFLRIIDHLLSNFYHSVVIMTWWAVWQLTDYYDPPIENGFYVLLIKSLIMGYLMITIIFIVENYYLKQLADENVFILHWVLHGILSFVAFVGTLLVWKGGWSIMDYYRPVNRDYIQPHQVIATIFGLLIMLIFNVGNTLTSIGFVRDGNEILSNTKIIITPNIKSFFLLRSQTDDQETEPIIQNNLNDSSSNHIHP